MAFVAVTVKVAVPSSRTTACCGCAVISGAAVGGGGGGGGGGAASPPPPPQACSMPAARQAIAQARAAPIGYVMDSLPGWCGPVARSVDWGLGPAWMPATGWDSSDPDRRGRIGSRPGGLLEEVLDAVRPALRV